MRSREKIWCRLQRKMRNVVFVLLLPLLACYVNSEPLQAESIIGGEIANRKQLPYQVSLQLGDSHFCGGALISPDTVLTASHCFYHDDYVPSVPYTVVAGTTNLRYPGKEIEVATVYVHKRYTVQRDNSVINDIAVLKLADKFDVGRNSAINVVALPETGTTFTGKTALVSGYGWDNVKVKYNWLTRNVKRTGSSDYKLKHMSVQVLSRSQCKTGVGKICAQSYDAYSEEQHGVCSGDSGGPLVYDNKIIGIVSYGITTCDEAEVPTVYTEVSAYLPFIKGAMNNKPIADTTVVHINPEYRSRPPSKQPINKVPGKSSYLREIQAKIDDLLAKWRSYFH